MDPAEFTVGWICALPLELAASRGMLEEEYDASKVQKHPRDTNKYYLGKVAEHKVVLTCLISAGNNQAGSTAFYMQNTFQHLRFILMVGIGGGVPGPSKKNDVRLGDVVISMPSGVYGGVIQYDAGKFLQDKEFLVEGALQAPPADLQKTVKWLIAEHEIEGNRITKHVNSMLERKPNLTRPETDYRRPSRGHDLLFKSDYVHEGDGDTCEKCDKKYVIVRKDRFEEEPVLHYGNIASGSSVVRDAIKRDQLGKAHGALCVEMEAAGLMNEFSCLVIRGICDYSDSHKNKDWQRYAAAVAAAYAKELLKAVTSDLSDVSTSSPIVEQEGYSPQSQAMQKTSSFGGPKFSPLSKTSSFPRAPTFQSVESGPSSSSMSGRVSFSHTASSQPRSMSTSTYTHPRDTHNREFSPFSRRATVDQHALSHAATSPPSSPPSSSMSPPFFAGRPESQRAISSRSPSKASSRSFAPGVWDGREGELLLTKTEPELKDFQSYDMLSQDPIRMERCRMKIFELVNDTFEIPTRRLVIRSSENEEQLVSYWMPADDVHIKIKELQMTISWSDCSHVISERRNYQTRYRCQYDPDDRNRWVEFDFAKTDLPDIQELSDRLLHPSLRGFRFHNISTKTEEPGYSNLGLYRTSTGGSALSLNAYSSPEFALLVTSTASDSTQYSKFYFCRYTLDLHFDAKHDYLLFRNVHRLNYVVSLEKSSENDLLRYVDREGGPERWNLREADLELWLAKFNSLSLKDLMERLTGWRLLFREEAHTVTLKGIGHFSSAKKIKNTIVTVWQRETETGSDLHLLVLASTNGGEKNDTPWLGTSLTRLHMTISKSDTVSLGSQTCVRGSKVAIDQMTLDSPHVVDTNLQYIRVSFEDTDAPHRFLAAARTMASKPSIQHRETITSTYSHRVN